MIIMNKSVRILIMIFCLTGLFFNACEDKDEPFGAVLETNLEQVTFGTNAEVKYVRVNTNRTVAVSPSNASWCSAELLEGEINNLKISVIKNEEIGKQRKFEFIISSDGLDSKKITVTQDGVAALIAATEKTVTVETGNEFSVEITANILFVFDLPEWIHEKSGNIPAVGTKTYYFTLDALADGEPVRSGSLVIKAADPEINASVAIPVKQGKEPLEDAGITKAEPYIVEAETSLEGYEAKYQEWWAASGTVFGDNHYINAYNASVSYAVKVADAGNYDFQFVQVSWSGGSFRMFLDDVEVGYSSIPNHSGDGVEIIEVNGVTLTTGNHIIKLQFTGNSDFDKFIVTYSANLIKSDTPCTIEAETSIEGYEAKYQEWWATSGTVFGDNHYINAYNASVSYAIKVVDAGNYNFQFVQVSWGGGSFRMFLDDVEVSSSSIPNHSGDGVEIIEVNGVTLTEGNHIIKLQFTGNSDFDKFTITHQ
jgi:hypothetical protein